ncbi:MAG: hypothetical protein H6815_02165 [Phycisphaeraceae bacterium]|nr:hypothetical protein [Phycisphaerales bacterium]MCB9859233.1 hypothetical protein [Phycisphaeraceae bacterium]
MMIATLFAKIVDHQLLPAEKTGNDHREHLQGFNNSIHNATYRYRAMPALNTRIMEELRSWKVNY